jgi:hypothetical protein
MIVLVVVEGVAVAMLSVLVAGLLRNYGAILRAVHSLGLRESRQPVPNPVTQPDWSAPLAPLTDIGGETPTGDTIAVGVTSSSRNTLLAFLSSGCLTCAEFWRALRDPAAVALPPRTSVVVVTKGPEAESQSAIRKLASSDLTVVMSTRAWFDYGVPGSPYFALVDGAAHKVVGEGTAMTWSQVETLIAQAVGDAQLARTQPAPAIAPGDRPERVDAALLAAGITPGHESLFFSPSAAEPDSRGHDRA